MEAKKPKADKSNIDKSKKPKEYEIRNFQDFMKVVNEENVDMLCGNFYGLVLQFIKMRKAQPKMKFRGFDWIDDGTLEVRGAKIKMTITGEIIHIENKKSEPNTRRKIK